MLPASMGSVKSKRTVLIRFIDTVEYLGNRLPHPITFFAYSCLFLLFLSYLASYFNIAIVDPRPNGSLGQSADGMVHIHSLLNAEGLKKITTNLVNNFINFGPLGVTLVALLGIAIAEHSGWLSAAIRQLLLNRSRSTVTFSTVFVSIISSATMPLGYVVVIPLSAMLFYSLGRHPLAGLAAAFSGIGAGYSANILLTTVDTILSGITQTSAQIIDSNYNVGAESNWYFMAASTFLLTLLGSFVTEKIIEPKLGKYDSSQASEDLSKSKIEKLKHNEKRALFWSNFSFIFILVAILSTIIPENGILRSETGSFSGSPFLHSIVAFIFIIFALPGIVYGLLTGTIRNDKDIISSMTSSISTMSMFIVLMFFVAQFINWFNWSNIGLFLSIYSAQILNESNLSGPVIFIACIAICSLINLMIGCAVVQWSIMGPIVIPTLMLVGYTPETIQAAYRIGDSVTNIISPMMPYFAMIVAVASRYVKQTGIGTIVSIMLPYSIVFFIFWSSFFCLWVFALGLPLGPDGNIFYDPN